MTEANFNPHEKLFARTVQQFPPKPRSSWWLVLAGLVIVGFAIGGLGH